jgi:hypothetical protein
MLRMPSFLVSSVWTCKPRASNTYSGVQGISESKTVCVMMMDILDASGSFLSRIRNIIGSNPVIVVATKMDLLPKGTDIEMVQAWFDDFVKFKKLNCLATHLVSSKVGAPRLLLRCTLALPAPACCACTRPAGKWPRPTHLPPVQCVGVASPSPAPPRP